MKTFTMMKQKGNHIFHAIVGKRETTIIMVIAIISLAISLRTSRFLIAENLRDIFINMSILVVVAIGQMMVISTAGIDLSLASTIGLSAMTVGLIISRNPFMAPLLTLPLGILIGLILGSFNGLLISRASVPPIIATLSTMGIYRGLILIVSNGKWVNTQELPKDFIAMTRDSFLHIPNLVWIALLVAFLAYLFIGNTRSGRAIFALGGNPTAAIMVGIRSRQILLMVYMISGALAGLAGSLWVSRQAAAWNDTALGYELNTVAACVLGGVNIMGGSGSVPGVLLGALLLGIVTNSLLLINISPFWQQAVYGALILISIIINALISGRIQHALLLRREK